MQRYISFLTLLLLVLTGFVSCESDIEGEWSKTPPVNYYFSVDKQQLDLGPSNTREIISVRTNGSWSASSDVSWITLSPSSGSSDGQVTISVEENNTSSDRTGEITVKSQQLNSTAKVRISQLANNFDLSIDHDSIGSSSAAFSDLITLTTNDEWAISSEKDWISFSVSSGKGDANININVLENKTPDERIAYINVTGKYSGKSTAVKVVQSGKKLSVNVNSLSFSTASESKTIIVTTDGTYTVSQEGEWFSIVQDADTLTVTSEKMIATEPRSGKIVIAMSNLTSGTLSQTIEVKQSGMNYDFSVEDSPITSASSASSSLFKITTNDDWAISTSESWIVVSSSSGSGNADITVNLSENKTTSSRTGSITVTGKNGGGSATINVSQDGKYLTVSPETVAFGSAADSQKVTISTDGTFTTNKSDSWISVTADGNTLTISATQNTTAQERSGSVTVSLSNLTSGSLSQTITVTQSALSHSLSVNKETISVGSVSTTEKFEIASNDSWEILSNVEWATLSLTTGSGNGIVSLTIGANIKTSSREGTITIKGANSGTKTIKITQEGESYTLGVDKMTLSVKSASASDIIEITSNDTWTATADVTWVKLSLDSGSGNKSLTVTVSENTAPTSREGTITIKSANSGTKTITVSQEGIGYSLSVDKTTISVGATGSTSESFTITSNDSWEASSDVTWTSLSAKLGSGDNTLIVTVSANAEETSREGTISIKGANSGTKTIKISQEGETYTLSVDKTTLSVGCASASDIIGITSNDSWTVSSEAGWIKLSMDSGSGSKSLTVTISENTSTSEREGKITIKGSNGRNESIISVIQDGAPSDLTLISPVLDLGIKAKSCVGLSFSKSWIPASDLGYDDTFSLETNNAGEAIQYDVVLDGVGNVISAVPLQINNTYTSVRQSIDIYNLNDVILSFSLDKYSQQYVYEKTNHSDIIYVMLKRGINSNSRTEKIIVPLKFALDDSSEIIKYGAVNVNYFHNGVVSFYLQDNYRNDLVHIWDGGKSPVFYYFHPLSNNVIVKDSKTGIQYQLCVDSDELYCNIWGPGSLDHLVSNRVSQQLEGFVKEAEYNHQISTIRGIYKNTDLYAYAISNPSIRTKIAEINQNTGEISWMNNDIFRTIFNTSQFKAYVGLFLSNECDNACNLNNVSIPNNIVGITLSRIDSSSDDVASENGHQYVDLGLPSGLLWATCNVGATNPEDSGDYFAWGETKTKSTYNWDTDKYYSGSGTSFSKYNDSSSEGAVDNKTVLDLEDDVAHVNWGGSWRMPTSAEQGELCDNNNCIWTWTTRNGVNGYEVRSRKNGNTLFLPVAGYYYDSTLSWAGTNGYYWSSSRSAETYYANFLSIDSTGAGWNMNTYRCYGLSIRPVCNSSK